MSLCSVISTAALRPVKIATSNAAVFLGKAESFGAIAVGKEADLVILAADPSLDVAALKSAETVIKAGAIIDRGRLQVPINAGPK